MNRRKFVKNAALSSSAVPFLGFAENIFSSPETDKLSISIFSKHLQFLDYYSLGEKAVELGFDGVDLTVRPNGHVLPQNVIIDLPKAVKEIQRAGSACKMITTSIDSTSNPLDVAIIESASAAKVAFYRTNWFKYKKGISMEASLLAYQSEIKKLGDLNKKLGIVGCYQNHAGTNVGSSFWESKKVLEKVDSNYFGVQYDVRHAMVEGGNSWVNGLDLLHKNIKCIVLKDFKWGKVNGKWEAINVPIGEGMVDFVSYFKLLKSYKLKPPVSLHLEYDLGGAEKGDLHPTVNKKVIYDAMKKDLNEVQRLWQIA